MAKNKKKLKVVRNDPEPKATIWSYLVVEVPATEAITDMAAPLNDYGAQGWEIVQMYLSQGSSNWVCLFKKLK